MSLQNSQKPARESPWKLRLYTAGQCMKTVAALQNLNEICDGILEGHYDLEVVDVLEHPELAESHRIMALPMLVRLSPLPERRIVGDLSDFDIICTALNLKPKRNEQS